MFLALMLIASAAFGVWLTIEPGRYRSLAWIVLGFFAFRVVLGRMRQHHTYDRKADAGLDGGLETPVEHSIRK